MAWYNKFKSDLKEIASCVQEEAPVIEPVPEGEWIWVEGYKGLDQNMQGYKDFQYELGVEYTTDGEIKACGNGFHFCLKLTDTFGYKDCLQDRFFKVRAYVKKSDVDSYGTIPRGDNYSWLSYPSRIDKLAAQKIILTEEISDTEEVISAIKTRYPEVNNVEEIEQMRLVGYVDFVKNKYKEKLSKYFSELFVELFVEKFSIDSLSRLKSKTNEIIAYMEEGVSKDVAIYLLMK